MGIESDRRRPSFGESGEEWRAYHEATSLTTLPDRIPESEWPQSWIDVEFKRYRDRPQIPLPEATLEQAAVETASLSDVLRERHTTRRFGVRKVRLSEVAALLRGSCGIRRAGAPDRGNRPHPSAGARYPLEVYPVALAVESLPTGVYHYAPQEDVLEALGGGSILALVDSLADSWMRDAGMLLVITAVFDRNFRKYGQRGYLEAGHVGQNFALLAAALGLGWCGVGAYLDPVVNNALEVDGLNETVVSMHLIGSR